MYDLGNWPGFYQGHIFYTFQISSVLAFPKVDSLLGTCVSVSLIFVKANIT
jgi:hypothetical protein